MICFAHEKTHEKRLRGPLQGNIANKDTKKYLVYFSVGLEFFFLPSAKSADSHFFLLTFSILNCIFGTRSQGYYILCCFPEIEKLPHSPISSQQILYNLCHFVTNFKNQQMKKLFSILVVVFFVAQTWAQSTEFIQQKDFKVEKQKINESINAARKQISEIKKGHQKMEQSVDSLKRKLGIFSLQLATANDSLVKTNTKLNALQETVDHEKTLPKGIRFLIMLIVLTLFIVLFVLVWLFKKKADQDHQSLVGLDKKTNERLDFELNGIKTEIQRFSDLIASLSDEMSRKLSAGLSTIEGRGLQLEQHLNENLARIEGRIDPIGPEIGKLKEEQASGIKNLHEKLNSLKHESDLLNQAMAAQTAKLEAEVRLMKGQQ